MQKDVVLSLALDQKCFGHLILTFYVCNILFFYILQQNGCSKNPKGPLFTFIGTYRRLQKLFSSFGYYRKEYLTLWSPFDIYEP